MFASYTAFNKQYKYISWITSHTSIGFAVTWPRLGWQVVGEREYTREIFNTRWHLILFQNAPGMHWAGASDVHHKKNYLFRESSDFFFFFISFFNKNQFHSFLHFIWTNKLNALNKIMKSSLFILLHRSTHEHSYNCYSAIKKSIFVLWTEKSYKL